MISEMPCKVSNQKPSGIMSLIGGFQAGFDQAYMMTGGGPNGSTTTIIYYLYNFFVCIGYIMVVP